MKSILLTAVLATCTCFGLTFSITVANAGEINVPVGVCIIDHGGSQEEIDNVTLKDCCEKFGGDYVEFTHGVLLCPDKK